MALTVEGKPDDYLKKSALVGRIILPGAIAAGSSVPIAQAVRNFQVRKDRRAAVIPRDRIVVSYRGQRMRPLQVLVNRLAAAMTDPAVALTRLDPDSLSCVAARTYVTACGADETACLLVAVWTPVHLCAAS
jgi:hypothetical protein